MAFGTWTDGNQLGATDVNTKIVQCLFVDKTAHETVTSSETIQNDNHLKFTAAASTNYWIKALIIVDGADTGGGIEFGWYGPSGATFDWCSDALGDDADGFGPVSRTRQQIGNLPAMATNGVATNLIIPAVGVLKVSTTAGVFGFRWAQDTSNATATRVNTGSGMIVTKLV
ncbi:hypothetical protein [Nonomuraea typhae]|uniref:hypothetical protein n=1 Tax=Nonomuraea typhae TaxID=2603600 RepID=UPI0012FA3616|nr:hypothetical protein [Nonomuraea typhae]